MTHFKIFANCLIVKGATRSLVCDLQRLNSDYVPNDMVQVIEKLNEKVSIKEVIKFYGKENESILEEYLSYLVEKDYGFYCVESDFNMFPELDRTYQTPGSITNIIIELKKENIFWLKHLVPQIEKLGCKDIAFIFYEELTEEHFNNIFQYFEDTRIKSFEITSKYHIGITHELLKRINRNLNQLTRLTLYGSPEEKIEPWDNEILFDRVFIKKEITSFKYCGAVNMKYFNTNLPKVLEAMKHNSCLYKKISIDEEGNIKNCPSMSQSFGNITNTTLQEALDHPDFKKYWNITKDQIAVCKDCEFRYICTDCRAYLENPEDQYSKPLKCGYDPYTNQWEEWSTNPLKQKAIEYYGMQDLVKKDA
ncbi:grasp-with-spasm system SPASM domain peptide maturase [Flagellimonas amoyensis]|uniref:grasp-with-spasm system SPASM domain peptide maturase n=1 Tax=Flagellimonas amoyensis TaxID=2169401 RepID=UPI000D3A6E31|nr:grasp-with-spasm system SPASM domain peptide maturase [Allomuricauda amoyensis]